MGWAMGDALLGGVMAMLAQSERRRVEASRQDLDDAVERLGFVLATNAVRGGDGDVVTRADGTALIPEDWQRFEETLNAVVAERRAREVEENRRRAEYDAKQRAERQAQWEAEQAVIAAPYREQRRLRNLAKMARQQKGKA